MSGSADLERRLQEASALSDQGEWDEAYDLLQGQLADHPDDALLLSMLGVAAQETGDDGAAYDYFRRALATDPTDPLILVASAVGLAAFDDPEAETAFRLAALSAPDLPITRLHYGGYLAREGHLELAMRELQAAKLLDEHDAAIRSELATAYLLAGRLEEGVAELEEALGLADTVRSRLLYALALLEAGRAEESAEELHRVAAEAEDDGEIQLLSALASAGQGWEDDAWGAHARAEQVGLGADTLILEEVEDALSAGADAAMELLVEELAPSVMRRRLLEPS